MNYWPLFTASLLVSFLSAPFLRRLAFKLDILDYPARRKVHKKATALLGGAVIYIGLLAGTAFNWRLFSPLLPIFFGATAVFIIGLIDDIRGLSARSRLIAEAFIVLILVKFGVCVSFLPPGFWGDLGEIIITLLWIVGVTNACNYLDGLDGLAAGSAIINLFSFSVILQGTNQSAVVVFSAMLICACLGFLPHNFRSAKMFLGDAGSTFLGFCIACIAIVGNWAQDNTAKLVIPILILGVPIFDMIFTTIVRIKEGKVKNIPQWLHYGGRDHFHHYLVELGFSPRSAVVFIYLFTLSLGISAIMLSNDRATEAFLAVLQAALIFVVIGTLIVVGKRRRSGWNMADRPEDVRK